MPIFGGTIKNPEHVSFGIVYQQLLDSIVNLTCVQNLKSLASNYITKFREQSHSHVMLMG